MLNIGMLMGRKIPDDLVLLCIQEGGKAGRSYIGFRRIEEIWMFTLLDTDTLLEFYCFRMNDGLWIGVSWKECLL